jgi:predicted transposase/invertase (TIGR01784 family)
MTPISLKDDLVFKAVFVKEPRLLKNFIQEILFPDREIIVDTVIVTNPELTIEYKDHKRAILDITATGTNGNIFHVEIQNTKRPYFSARTVFYASKLIVNQIKSGENYSAIRPVYQIILVDYRVFDGIHYSEQFQLRGVTNPNHIFYDGLLIHLIDLSNLRRLKYKHPLSKSFFNQRNPSFMKGFFHHPVKRKLNLSAKIISYPCRGS